MASKIMIKVIGESSNNFLMEVTGTLRDGLKTIYTQYTCCRIEGELLLVSWISELDFTYAKDYFNNFPKVPNDRLKSYKISGLEGLPLEWYRTIQKHLKKKKLAKLLK